MGTLKVPVPEGLSDGASLDGVLSPRLVGQTLTVDVARVQEIAVHGWASNNRIYLHVEDSLVVVQEILSLLGAVRREAGLVIGLVEDYSIVLGVEHENRRADKLVCNLVGKYSQSLAVAKLPLAS